MTTRLSQQKVKAGSPAYKNLAEEMQARNMGSGTDYIIPVGGIPRTDMTKDVQDAIAQAEASYVFPVGGITEADLSQTVQDRLMLSDTAYQKPSTGIPAIDLELSIQERLNEFKDFYVFPSTGIPYVDLDPDVQKYLQDSLKAYNKPSSGIPVTDLEQDVQDKLEASLTKYVKPEGGIPLTDLAEEVATKSDLNKYASTPHRHSELLEIGEYTHEVIDELLDEHHGILVDVTDEIEFARGEYSTIGRRLDNAFFERHDYIIKDLGFNKGSMTNLMLSEDNNLHFAFAPEPILVEYYDMSTTTGYEQSNKMREEEIDVLEKRWPNEILMMNGNTYSSNVGIRVDGFIYAPKTGVYNFGVQASGSYEFIVNTTKGKFDASDLTKWDDDHVSRPITVTLTGGQFYRFSILGKNLRATNSLLRVVWKRPGDKTFEPVGKECFTKVGYNSPDLAIYETKVIDTEKLDIRKFNWNIETDHHTPFSYIELEWRQSADNIAFSEWFPYSFGVEIEENIKRFFQARLTFVRGATNVSPVVKEIRLDFLSNKNRLYHEWEEARKGYTTLREHMDALNDRINGVEDLATSIDHSVIDTSWLQNVRFEHIDINLMRMHWEQLKALKTSAHIMPSGFVEDFHDLNLMDDTFHDMEVRDSKLYPVPLSEIFDTNLDWDKWDRFNLSPENDSMKLTFSLNPGLTGPSVETIISDMGGSAASISSGNAQNVNYYQVFPVENHSFQINTIKTKGYRYFSDTGGGGAYNSRVGIYISVIKPDGKYDHTKEKYLGDACNYSNQGAVTTIRELKANYVIPIGTKEIGMRIEVGYTGSNYYYSGQTIQVATTSSDPKLNGTSDGKIRYLLDKNQNPITNRFAFIEVSADRAYHAEGEAQVVTDFGFDTNFMSSDIDVTLNGGVVEMKYASSSDGNIYSALTNDLNEVPDGRYLKVWTRLSRSPLNVTPAINKLVIRHNPNDVILQTKPVRVSRVPTHAIVDVVDSDSIDISYEISRDGGQTFKPIIPGMQTDLRDIGSGQEMIIRMMSINDMQDDKVWIDYIGLQTITHEDYNDKSVIVSHHQVEKALQGQQQFDSTKPYFVGDNSLQVYVNGSYQIEGVSYDEINNRSIMMRYPLMKGDIVVLRIATAAYAFADNESLAEMLIETKQTIESTLPFLQDVKPRVETIEAEQIIQDHAIDALNTRIDNEVIAINTRVEEVNVNAGLAIESVVTDLIAVDTKVDLLTSSVTTIDEQIKVIDSVVQGLSSTDAILSQQLSLLQQTVELIKTDLEEVKALMAVGTTDFEELKGRVDVVEGELQTIHTQLGTIVSRLDAMDLKDIERDTKILDVDTKIKAAQVEYPKEMSRIDTEMSERITSVQNSIMQVILETDEVNDSVAEALATRLTEIEFLHPSHVERVNRDKMSLNLESLDADLGTNGIQLDKNVTLPNKGQWDSTITWQSDKPQFVSGAGVVNKPTYTQGDQAVLLTATINYSGLTDTKVFTVNVVKLPPSEEEMVLEDKNALNIDHLDQDEETGGIQILTDVTLPSVGSVRESAITWESSHSDNLNSSGVVVQPEFVTGDIVVTLSATLKKGSAIETKAFSLTVPALPEVTEEPIVPDPPAEIEPEIPEEPEGE